MINSETNPVDFFSRNEISVSLTYAALPVAMVFYLAIALDSEAKLLRQDFFALTKEQQAERQIEQNIKLVSQLAVKLPENVPGLPEFVERENLRLCSPGEILRKFFAAAATNPVKAKVLEDLLSVYWGRVQPAEFFRGV